MSDEDAPDIPDKKYRKFLRSVVNRSGIDPAPKPVKQPESLPGQRSLLDDGYGSNPLGAPARTVFKRKKRKTS